MPNRFLKESICYSETLDKLTAEEERLFYRLLVQCDDFGRFDARVKVLRSRCFQLQADVISLQQMSSWLSALAREELIVLYEVNGRPYLQVVTWDKYQQRRATKSKYPALSEGQKIEPDSNCEQVIANDNNGKQMSPYSYPYSYSYLENEYENDLSRPSLPARTVKTSYNPAHMELAELLRDRILANKSDYKTPSSLDKWANTIRLMVDRDNRSLERVRAVIEWCQQDEFWRTNILSAGTLREKFDQLEGKMREKKYSQPHIPRGFASLEEWATGKDGPG